MERLGRRGGCKGRCKGGGGRVSYIRIGGIAHPRPAHKPVICQCLPGRPPLPPLASPEQGTEGRTYAAVAPSGSARRGGGVTCDNLCKKNRYVKGQLGTRICSGTGAPLWAGLWGGVHDSRRHRLMPCTGYSRVPHLYQQRRGACVHGSPAATGDVTSQEGAALLSWGVHPYERNSPPKTWRA